MPADSLSFAPSAPVLEDPFLWTKHILGRCLQRSIPQAVVEAVVMSPFASGSLRRGLIWGIGPGICGGKSRWVKVVYRRDPDGRILLITAYFPGRGGARQRPEPAGRRLP